MIMGLLKKSLHLLLVFSFIFLHVEPLLAVGGGDSDDGYGSTSSTVPQAGPSDEAQLDPEAQLIPLTRNQRSLVDGLHSLKFWRDTIDHSPVAFVYVVDPQKDREQLSGGMGSYSSQTLFLEALDREFFGKWCHTSKKVHAAQIMGSLFFMTAGGAWVPVTSFGLYNTFNIPLNGWGELTPLIGNLIELLPILGRQGYDRLGIMTKSMVGETGFKPTGKQDRLPHTHKKKPLHKAVKLYVAGTAIAWSLLPGGVFLFLAEDVQDDPQFAYPYVFAVSFFMSMAEIYYAIGQETISRAFRDHFYEGSSTALMKRMLLKQKVEEFQRNIAGTGPNAQNLINWAFTLIIKERDSILKTVNAEAPREVVSLISVLIMYYNNPLVDWGSAPSPNRTVQVSSEGGEELRLLSSRVTSLSQEAQEFAGMYNQFMTLVTSMDYFTKLKSKWSGISTLLTGVTMGLRTLFQFGALEYIFQLTLTTIGVDPSIAKPVADVVSGVVTGSKAVLEWNEVQMFFESLPLIFSRAEDFWGVRKVGGVYAASNAALICLMEWVVGKIVFGDMDIVMQSYLLGANFVGDFAIFHRFFNKKVQNIITGVVTAFPEKAQSIQRRRAVLNFYAEKLKDFWDKADIETVQEAFHYFVEPKKEE